MNHTKKETNTEISFTFMVANYRDCQYLEVSSLSH